MTTTTERPPAKARAPRRGRTKRWVLVVSAVLIAWLGAQAIAGWKFANGRTYPVVGSAMFNGPPNGSGHDFMVPRVFAVTTDGTRIEMDQHTFAIEPFEWRRWIQRNLELPDDPKAAYAAKELASVFAEVRPDAPAAVSIEVWRVPAPDATLDRGRMVRTVTL